MLIFAPMQLFRLRTQCHPEAKIDAGLPAGRNNSA